MKALIITPTPTHPTTQGNRARVYQIASALKRQGASVDLLYYAIDGIERDGLERMREAWDTVYLVSPTEFKAQRTYPSSWGLDDWISPNLLSAARGIAGSVKYEAVVINYVWCSLLFEVFPEDTLRVLDTHDAFGARRDLALRVGLQPHWFYTSVNEEARGLSRSDVVLAIQPEEGAYFSAITAAKVEVVEYAIPPNFMPPRPRRSQQEVTIGYIGSGNPWNVKGLAALDSAIVEQCGGNLGALRGRYLLFGGITKVMTDVSVFESCGIVADVSDAYCKTDVVVNPMIGGTGLKIKTVEGLAFGRPVLSTKSGASGLGVAHTDLMHEDVKSLARRANELARNPMELIPLAEEMKSAYEAFYTKTITKVEQTAHDIVSGRLKESTGNKLRMSPI